MTHFQTGYWCSSTGSLSVLRGHTLLGWHFWCHPNVTFLHVQYPFIFLSVKTEVASWNWKQSFSQTLGWSEYLGVGGLFRIIIIVIFKNSYKFTADVAFVKFFLMSENHKLPFVFPLRSRKDDLLIIKDPKRPQKTSPNSDGRVVIIISHSSYKINFSNQSVVNLSSDLYFLTLHSPFSSGKSKSNFLKIPETLIPFPFKDRVILG